MFSFQFLFFLLSLIPPFIINCFKHSHEVITKGEPHRWSRPASQAACFPGHRQQGCELTSVGLGLQPHLGHRGAAAGRESWLITSPGPSWLSFYLGSSWVTEVLSQTPRTALKIP